MRAILLALVCVAAVVRADLATEVAELRRQLHDRQQGEILFFRDRSDCPEGYVPAENAYGRVLVIDGDQRGATSEHTFDDRRVLAAECTGTVGVAESGFHRVCNHDGPAITVKLDEFVPYLKVLACTRHGGPSPVVP
jgi:hypothetical protein